MGPYAARGMPLDVFYLSLVTIAFAQALPMSVCSGLLVESQGHTFQELRLWLKCSPKSETQQARWQRHSIHAFVEKHAM